VLVLVLPGAVLYTVFTLIFEGEAGRPFYVAVIDHDNSEASQRLIEMLKANEVRVVTHEENDPEQAELTVESARKSIRREGLFRVAIVIPEGYGDAPTRLSGGPHHGVDLYADMTQPMEAEIATGMIQMAAGRALFERMGAMVNLPHDGAGDGDSENMLIDVERHDIGIRRERIASKHVFLGALVPMFVLFGAAGAARGLLSALQSGEVRRILAAPVRVYQLLLGQFICALVVAMLQCYSMYAYAWLVFDVAIWQFGWGLFLLTLMTCLAATGLGMLLASLCGSVEHLDALGTTVILAMSAIGGSMVPRFVMPRFMQKLSNLTLNGWSYDGFIALIRHEGWKGLQRPCFVLAGFTVLFAGVGCVILSRRFREAPAA
jgi:ABC-2 type transport system permease protein